jgi:hypothetical protein
MTVTTRITERARGEPGRRPRRLYAAEFHGPAVQRRLIGTGCTWKTNKEAWPSLRADCSVRDTRLDLRGVEAYLDWARDPCWKGPESSQSQVHRIHLSIHLRPARLPSLGDGDRVRRPRLGY